MYRWQIFFPVCDGILCYIGDFISWVSMLIAGPNACATRGFCSKSYFLGHQAQQCSIFSSLTDSEFWFLYWELKYISSWVCLEWDIRIDFHYSINFIQVEKKENFVECTAFSPMFINGLFVKIQVAVAMWAYICIFNSVPLINGMCLFLYQSNTSFYYCSYDVYLEIWGSITSISSFILLACFGYPDSLVFLCEI